MANLIFFDDSHTYQVDGVEVPSVSEVTRFISREVYRDVNQYALDTAANRGTRVHKATEILDKYGSAEVDDEVKPYVLAYLEFRRTEKPEWEKIEWAVCNDFRYAGTIDRYGEMNGQKVIVDIKTTQSIDKAHKTLYTAAQNLYRMAAEKQVKVDKLYILQLLKDEKYKLIELPIDDDLAMSCLTLHEALKKKKRVKKEEDKQDG